MLYLYRLQVRCSLLPVSVPMLGVDYANRHSQHVFNHLLTKILNMQFSDAPFSFLATMVNFVSSKIDNLIKIKYKMTFFKMSKSGKGLD